VIVHWNGKTWQKVPSPSPPESGLAALADISARNAWAVGFHGIAHPRTLILRWVAQSTRAQIGAGERGRASRLVPARGAVRCQGFLATAQ
jgi:hypothetical protein